MYIKKFKKKKVNIYTKYYIGLLININNDDDDTYIYINNFFYPFFFFITFQSLQRNLNALYTSSGCFS